MFTKEYIEVHNSITERILADIFIPSRRRVMEIVSDINVVRMRRADVDVLRCMVKEANNEYGKG